MLFDFGTLITQLQNGHSFPLAFWLRIYIPTQYFDYPSLSIHPTPLPFSESHAIPYFVYHKYQGARQSLVIFVHHGSWETESVSNLVALHNALLRYTDHQTLHAVLP